MDSLVLQKKKSISRLCQIMEKQQINNTFKALTLTILSLLTSSQENNQARGVFEVVIITKNIIVKKGDISFKII